jgi:hypothetical protein
LVVDDIGKKKEIEEETLSTTCIGGYLLLKL